MEVVDLDKAKQLVRDAVARHPNRRNPQSDGGCVYTSVTGKSHCIAGQVFADLNLDVPGPEIECGLSELPSLYGDYGDLPTRFTNAAWEYLCKAQYVFDGGRIKEASPVLHGASPRRWSQALSLLEEYEDTLSGC